MKRMLRRWTHLRKLQYLELVEQEEDYGHFLDQIENHSRILKAQFQRNFVTKQVRNSSEYVIRQNIVVIFYTYVLFAAALSRSLPTLEPTRYASSSSKFQHLL